MGEEMRHPNKFISKKLAENKSYRIPINSGWQDVDTGIFYKWDGKKFVQIPLSDMEELAQAFDDLKKEILESWIGRFMFWILDRLSQMINWVGRKK